MLNPSSACSKLAFCGVCLLVADSDGGTVTGCFRRMRTTLQAESGWGQALMGVSPLPGWGKGEGGH